jgi:hypothetical protein
MTTVTPLLHSFSKFTDHQSLIIQSLITHKNSVSERNHYQRISRSSLHLKMPKYRFSHKYKQNSMKHVQMICFKNVAPNSTAFILKFSQAIQVLSQTGESV